MREWEKAQRGFLYDANHDEALLRARDVCGELCWRYNLLNPTDHEGQRALLEQILGKMGEDVCITPPFFCDYGTNISVGRNFYTNHNCVILDGAPVRFGDDVFIAPNCVFSTAGHAIDPEQRAAGLEIARPITVGDRVWIGANVSVLPGVTIGSDTVIGAGSVVTRDIPSGVVAVGSPCRVLRAVTQKDRNRYPGFPG